MCFVLTCLEIWIENVRCISWNHCCFYFFGVRCFIYFCVCIIFRWLWVRPHLSVLSTFLPSTPFTEMFHWTTHTNKRTNNEKIHWKSDKQNEHFWIRVRVCVSECFRRFEISNVIDSSPTVFIQSLWFRSQGILFLIGNVLELFVTQNFHQTHYARHGHIYFISSYQ